MLTKVSIRLIFLTICAIHLTLGYPTSHLLIMGQEEPPQLIPVQMLQTDGKAAPEQKFFIIPYAKLESPSEVKPSKDNHNIENMFEKHGPEGLGGGHDGPEDQDESEDHEPHGDHEGPEVHEAHGDDSRGGGRSRGPSGGRSGKRSKCHTAKGEGGRGHGDHEDYDDQGGPAAHPMYNDNERGHPRGKPYIKEYNDGFQMEWIENNY